VDLGTGPQRCLEVHIAEQQAFDAGLGPASPRPFAGVLGDGGSNAIRERLDAVCARTVRAAEEVTVGPDTVGR
jgi:hypothetical protein